MYSHKCHINVLLMRLRVFFLFAVIMLEAIGCVEHRFGDKTADYYFDNPQLNALARAAATGDEAEIQSLIKQGVKVNAQGKDMMTPLFWAVTANNMAGVEILLKQGANPNQVGADGMSAISYVVESGNSKLLELLLKYGGDPNIKQGGEPIIHLAITNRRWEIMRMLIASHADINALNGWGEPPIMALTTYGQYDQILYLLEHGADYMKKDTSGYELAEEMVVQPTGDPEWKEKVRQFLESHGVTFPVSRDEVLAEHKRRMIAVCGNKPIEECPEWVHSPNK